MSGNCIDIIVILTYPNKLVFQIECVLWFFSSLPSVYSHQPISYRQDNLIDRPICWRFFAPPLVAHTSNLSSRREVQSSASEIRILENDYVEFYWLVQWEHSIAYIVCVCYRSIFQNRYASIKRLFEVCFVISIEYVVIRLCDAT